MRRWIQSSFIAFLRGSSFLSGKWYQMLASRFVVDTVQLGHKCTTWNFTHIEGNHWTIHQHSHLHYMTGFDTEKDFSVWTKTQNSKFLLQDDNLFTTDLWLRNKTDDILMFMGMDNLSFYILARDPEEFQREKVTQLLDSWDYNTYYKTPITTYDLSCLQ